MKIRGVGLKKNEIPLRQLSQQPKMIKWVFHVTVKKQIIIT
jgi:hypothetical protein